MAGNARKSANALRCPALRVDGVVCNHVVVSGWDYCVRHAERRGEELLKEVPARITLEVTIPAFPVPLGGLTRSQWEAVRLEMCGLTLPPEDEPPEISAKREVRARLGMPAEATAA